MPATEDAEVDPQAALQSLSAEWGFPADPEQTASLLRFADLLIRWNQSINLTGAKSVGAVVAEHYPDAFALARRLDGPARLVDVGSGGAFRRCLSRCFDRTWWFACASRSPRRPPFCARPFVS